MTHSTSTPVTDIPPLAIQTLTVPYQESALEAFLTLRPESGSRLPECTLLESADVRSGDKLSSLMMLQPALRLTCYGQTVTAEALTEAGQVALGALSSGLGEYADSLTPPPGAAARFTFSAPPPNLSEEERLRAVGNLEPLRALQRLLAGLAEQGEGADLPLLMGVFGFDLLASFEMLPDVTSGPNTCPDYRFYLAQTALVIDHKAGTATLLGLAAPGQAAQMQASLGALAAALAEAREKNSAAPPIPTPHVPAPPVPTALAELPAYAAHPSAAEFMAQVRALGEHIQAGDIYQVVPSRRFTVPCADALAAYAELKRLNPSPYLFYLCAGEFELFGASPESALKFTAATRRAELYPIAGTRARGRDAQGRICPERDRRQELELRLDRKELSEHLMLLDLARNDLARVAVPGTRQVARLLEVDRYSQVMHLVSEVVAELRPEFDALDAYRACMNMGTLSGAPKLEATRLLRETEGERRGSYGGAVGYLSGRGDMDTCIVIRSGFVQGGQCTVQAGAGVVRDSDPAAETAETEQKARAVLLAVAAAERRRAQAETAQTAMSSVQTPPLHALPISRVSAAPLPSVLMIDNRDSFVYNLLDELAAAGMPTEVYRNDVPAEQLLARLETLRGQHPQGHALLVLSPGPGHPSEAGGLLPLLRGALGRFPVLGICLGFQALLEVSGAAVGRVGAIHGEAQSLTLSETGKQHPLFEGLGAAPSVARYHSLGTRESADHLRALGLEPLADIDGICMAAEHRQYAALGYQFHPESVLSPVGRELLLQAAHYLTLRHEQLTSTHSSAVHPTLKETHA